MIFRSVSKHVNDQNWFAVVIDFAIVVFGVFFGLQIGDWNNQRLQTEKTEILTERLANDFGVDLWVASSFLAYHQDVLANAKLVLDDLTNREHLTDNKLLISAFRATQFNRLNHTPTYKELLSTGGYELLAKSELGKIATVFYKHTVVEDIEGDGKSSDYRHLFRTIIPIEVQLEAAELCGDGPSSLENIMNEKSTLSYDCKLTLSESQLSEAASKLRSQPEFSDFLRRRIASLSAQVRDLKILLERTKPYRASKEILKRSGVVSIFVY